MRIIPRRFQTIPVAWARGSRATVIWDELPGSELSPGWSGRDRFRPAESRRIRGFVAEPSSMVGNPCGRTSHSLPERDGGEGSAACRGPGQPALDGSAVEPCQVRLSVSVTSG
jgi:hypothetical protein